MSENCHQLHVEQVSLISVKPKCHPEEIACVRFKLLVVLVTEKVTYSLRLRMGCQGNFLVFTSILNAID